MMLSNVRLALRSLAKAPGFSLIAILTLALGIGSTTAIYSVLRALVIEPFRYPQAQQLVMVWSGEGWSLSPGDSMDLRTQAKSFAQFGVYQPQTVNVGLEHAQSCMAVKSSSEVLRVFAVQPLLGRLFETKDQAAGAAPVTVISYQLWQEQFGGDARALDRTIRVNGSDAKVIGVMPKDFEFASPWLPTANCQLWLPLSMTPDESVQRQNHYLLGIARLQPGVSVAMADAEIKAIGARLAKAYPDTNTGKLFAVHSLYDEMTKGGKEVWMLLGCVILVLLVACANVASMLLARATKRQGEFGVRAALGASRWQLGWVMLNESAVLALVGCGLGLAFAWWSVHVLRVLAPVTEARKSAMAIDASSLGFALGAAVLSTLLAGLSPALAATRTSVAAVLRDGMGGAVGSHSRHRVLRNLVVAQVAVAFTFATGAELFARGYLKLIDENKILQNDHVITARFALSGPRYAGDEPQVRFWYECVRRVQAIPGVQHVAVASKIPLEGGSNTNALVNDEVYDPSIHRLQVERSSVTEDYFAAMGLRLLQGRNLKSEDRIGDIRGVVVNQEMVKRAWPDKDPIGQVMRGNNPGKPWFTARVVGVVENVKQWSADSPVQAEMYTTPEGHWGPSAYIVVNTTLPVEQLAPMIRDQLSAIDREIAIRDIRTMRRVLENSTQGQRTVSALVDIFMAIALGLVAVGIYGTASYHVQLRTREIGVRVAVGAVKSDIFGLVFAQVGRWIAFGIAIGLCGSLAVAAVLKNLVYGMTSLSWLPLVFACVAVGATAFIACWLPARRAAAMNALDALRAD